MTDHSDRGFQSSSGQLILDNAFKLAGRGDLRDLVRTSRFPNCEFVTSPADCAKGFDEHLAPRSERLSYPTPPWLLS
jgi:hypothetical protein